MDKVQTLALYYPLDDILTQNDIEVEYILRWLVEEKMIDIEDYFFDDVEEDKG